MMTLHTNDNDFSELIKLTSIQLGIAPEFVEKDYWITLLLNRLSSSKSAESIVFKGGTSLSKGYQLISRFSEDIDIATINENLTGNALKVKIRAIEKSITSELSEIVEPEITSKGSMFRKSVFQYPSVITDRLNLNLQKRIILEINSFANPYPFISLSLNSFIGEFLLEKGNHEVIDLYGLSPFSLNVLDKRQTMVEKLVSLIRFSFDENLTIALTSKIRHFYDLYFLVNDPECVAYIRSTAFQKDFDELMLHDQRAFDIPTGWQAKQVCDSPLITGFFSLWEKLRGTYQNELSQLAFSAIPDEKEIADTLSDLLFDNLSFSPKGSL